MLAALSPAMLLDIATTDAFVMDILRHNTGPVFFVSLLSTAYTYMIYFAATQTYVVHTLLMCSIATTFITTWKIARKLPFTKIEYFGIAANVFGSYLCCCEGAYIASIFLEFTQNIEYNMLLGNFCAIFSSAIMAIYIIHSTPLMREEHLPYSIYLALVSINTIVISIIVSMFSETPVGLFSSDPVNGVLGMFATKYFLIYLAKIVKILFMVLLA